jgi:predicted small lipoprotein YifL
MPQRHNVAAALCYKDAVGFGERVLPDCRVSIRVALALAGIAAVGLSGCGRAGPLELPPGPATPTVQMTSPDGRPVPGSAQDTAVRTGFDEQGNPVALPGDKKSFILDPLLR